MDRKGNGKMESVGVVECQHVPPLPSFDLGISCTPIMSGAVNLTEMFQTSEAQECVDDVIAGVLEGVASDDVDVEATNEQTKAIVVWINLFQISIKS